MVESVEDYKRQLDAFAEKAAALDASWKAERQHFNTSSPAVREGWKRFRKLKAGPIQDLLDQVRGQGAVSNREGGSERIAYGEGSFFGCEYVSACTRAELLAEYKSFFHSVASLDDSCQDILSSSKAGLESLSKKFHALFFDASSVESDLEELEHFSLSFRTSPRADCINKA